MRTPSVPTLTHRKFRFRLLKRLSLSFVFLVPIYAQPWSGILTPSRGIDWSKTGLPATFPDGETTANPWTPPVRSQCGSTINPSGGDDTTIINNAISACASAHYVLLGSGTFQIAGKLALSGAHNVSLRGSGSATTLKVGSAGSVALGLVGSGSSATLTSGSNYAAGSTVITVTGATPPLGQPLFLTQCDTGHSGAGCNSGADADNGGVWICGGQTICSNQPASSTTHSHQQQTVVATAVSGNCSSSCNVTISPGLYMRNWAFASTPTLSWNDPTWTAIGMGFEDMTVDFTSGTSNFGHFEYNGAYASWVKGVRFVGPSAGSCCAIMLANVGASLFANNYIYDVNPASGTGGGLAMAWGADSGVLILNNFAQGSGISELEGTGNDSGNVLAYNYFRDSATSQLYNGEAEHSASPNFILREGNQFGVSNDDATWGTHNLDTWFRNNISCGDGPYKGQAAPRGIIIDNFSRFENAIGNIINSSGACTAYQGQGSSPYEFGFGVTDGLSQSTSMRWGNCDRVNNACRFVSSEVPTSLSGANATYSNPVPSSQALPPTFFLGITSTFPNGGTGLSWWKVCTSWTTFPTACAATSTSPFPLMGPDVSGGPYTAGTGSAYDTPAALAYKFLPIDSRYQNSYTVTGSSWSGGTLTLTVSGLPGSNNFINGGFQLSGVNSACLPTSGVSYTARPDGEILMTGSSTTTVSYALAANPGTSCTGTMKWPDLRLFDERVYQADSSAGSGNPPPPPPTSPPPPTGVSATIY